MANHLSDAVETLAVELEGLLKQHFVFHGPVIREGCEVGQVQNGLLQVVFVPVEHAQRLLSVVPVFFFSQCDVVVHFANKSKRTRQSTEFLSCLQQMIEW